jgi:general secretion pathway protein I
MAAHANKDAGFTLMEAIVALAIAALGLSFMVAAVGTGLENARTAEQYVKATRAAQSHLAEIGASIPLAEGTHAGIDPAGFAWRVRIVPSGHASSDASGGGETALILYDVEASASWASGAGQRSVTLHSERLGKPEAPK